MLATLVFCTVVLAAAADAKMERDVVKTSAGDLTISFIGHGTLMLQVNGKTIHVDPWSKLADYGTLPKADIVLITHHHSDHLDTAAIDRLVRHDTRFIVTQEVRDQIQDGTVLRNGDTTTVDGILIEAVPAYNTTKDRDKYHPFGRDNGYILTIGGKRIYIAGDTENTPEMAALKNIDIAFLPMNQPYTMLPAQVAEAVKAFRPKILYPYHYGETDLGELKKLLANEKGIEVRVRSMK